jgi:hypothetical protein
MDANGHSASLQRDILALYYTWIGSFRRVLPVYRLMRAAAKSAVIFASSLCPYSFELRFVLISIFQDGPAYAFPSVEVRVVRKSGKN